MKRKAILINTIKYDDIFKKEENYGNLCNLGLGYIASVLREENFEILLIDINFKNTLSKRLSDIALLIDNKVKIVGFTVNTEEVSDLKIIDRLIYNIKKINNKIVIILGGYFVTLKHEYVIKRNKNIDIIVRGEGEETIKELIQNLDNKENWKNIKGITYRNKNEIYVNEERSPLLNLDKLPFPILPDIENYKVIPISTIRGCLCSCIYCGASRTNNNINNVRYRSVDNILMEILERKRINSNAIFSFLDSDFIGFGPNGKKRVLEFIDKIKKNDIKIKFMIETRPNNVNKTIFLLLKEIGLIKVFLGVDSFCDNVLERWKKSNRNKVNMRAISILEELKIDYSIGLILFDFDTDIKEIERNISIIINNKLYEKLRINLILVPFLNTFYYNYLISKIEVFPFNILGNHYLYYFKNKDIQLIFFLVNDMFSKRNNIIKMVKFDNNIENKILYKIYKLDLITFKYIINYIKNDKLEKVNFLISKYLNKIKKLLLNY